MVILRKIKGIMAQNADRHHKLKLALTLIFPLFIVLMTELNQMHSFGNLLAFILHRPSILIFDVLIVSALYAAVLLISRRVYVSVFTLGLAFMAISYVEYYKYGSTGTHFSVLDLAMSVNLGDMGQFTTLSFSPLLFATTMLTLTYFIATLLLNATISFRTGRRLFAGVLSGAVCAIMVVSPTVSSAVYDVFEVNTQDDLNVFMSDEKFQQNELIAYFTQSISKVISKQMKEPEGYSKENVKEALQAQATLDTSFARPNVIIILSESFADFRTLGDVYDIDADTYAGYDKVKSEGLEGKSYVPTIGGYTVMTEFEMTFGLPIKSVNGFTMPQRLIDDSEEQVTTFAQYYDSLNYYTAYIHPFNKTFYSRDSIYGTYGYDGMFFADSLENKLFRQYIDDAVVFDKAVELIEGQDDPAFVFAMTMQNHKPYEDENHQGDELGYYLDGVQHTSDALAAFTEQLKDIDEPTLVFFMGDHWPCFMVESHVFDRAGIDENTCYKLYSQSYLLWSNYDADYSAVPEKRVSAFYLPHVLTDVIGAPKTDFISTVLEKMETIPNYTQTGHLDTPHDEDLDLLTYDRIMGDRYSYQEVDLDENNVISIGKLD